MIDWKMIDDCSWPFNSDFGCCGSGSLHLVKRFERSVLHERAREMEEGIGSNRCQSSPPKSSACCHGAITARHVRWVSGATQCGQMIKGKKKTRLGNTKQKYKPWNFRKKKHQGIKADNHEIKVCLVRYISDSIFTLFWISITVLAINQLHLLGWRTMISFSDVYTVCYSEWWTLDRLASSLAGIVLRQLFRAAKWPRMVSQLASILQ